MKVVLAVLSAVCLWQMAECVKRPKSSHITKNPTSATVTEHVYFDVTVHHYYKKNEALEGRFVVAVFGDLLPMTVLNFVSIARGYSKGKKFLSYNSTSVHRIVQDFMVQFGDVEHRNGYGGQSIYSEKFRDEGFYLSHSSSGMVSMANEGPDSNGSQFFITLQPARYLDSKYVAFGKIIAGMDIIRKLGDIKMRSNGLPEKTIQVTACGVEGLYNKYAMTSQQLSTGSEEFNAEDFYTQRSEEEDDK